MNNLLCIFTGGRITNCAVICVSFSCCITKSIDLIPCHWNRQQPAPVPLVSDASGGIAYIVHPVFGEANTWFHLAVTLEPTSATNMMEATVYANGVNIGSSLVSRFSVVNPINHEYLKHYLLLFFFFADNFVTLCLTRFLGVFLIL